MFNVGDRVRITEQGVSVFVVVEVVDDSHVVIESEQDAPGRYPFPTSTAHLHLVTE